MLLHTLALSDFILEVVPRGFEAEVVPGEFEAEVVPGEFEAVFICHRINLQLVTTRCYSSLPSSHLHQDCLMQTVEIPFPCTRPLHHS